MAPRAKNPRLGKQKRSEERRHEGRSYSRTGEWQKIETENNENIVGNTGISTNLCRGLTRETTRPKIVPEKKWGRQKKTARDHRARSDRRKCPRRKVLKRVRVSCSTCPRG